jgi:hypothetical protein
VQQCRGALHLSVCMVILVLVLTVATYVLAGKFVSHIDYWDAVSVLDVSPTPCYCQLNGGHSMNGGMTCAFSASPTNKHQPQTNIAYGVKPQAVPSYVQIENQEFFSFEAARHLIGQLTTLAQAPRKLDTPDFLILRRFGDCDVRR